MPVVSRALSLSGSIVWTDTKNHLHTLPRSKYVSYKTTSCSQMSWLYLFNSPIASLKVKYRVCFNDVIEQPIKRAIPFKMSQLDF